MTPPVRVHVPFTRRVRLSPASMAAPEPPAAPAEPRASAEAPAVSAPEAPPTSLFLTEGPPQLAKLPPRLAKPPSPPVKRTLSHALLWRMLGGALCGFVLVSGVIVGLLSGSIVQDFAPLVMACALLVLAWPPLSVALAALRVVALHALLERRGLTRRGRRHSLRAALEVSSPIGAVAWLPGLGVAGLVLTECQALAALHRLPQSRVLGFALCVIPLPFASAMMSGVLLALLLT